MVKNLQILKRCTFTILKNETIEVARQPQIPAIVSSNLIIGAYAVKTHVIRNSEEKCQQLSFNSHLIDPGAGNFTNPFWKSLMKRT